MIRVYVTIFSVVAYVSGTTYVHICGSDFEVIVDPHACRYFWQCSHGQAFKKDCGEGRAYSAKQHVCVHVDDADCSSEENKGQSKLTLEEQCENVATLLTHPIHCQLYYDCSLGQKPATPFLSKFMAECSYPDLFSHENKTCQNFETVDCGNRSEPKTRCEYRRYWCAGPHCIPCHHRHGSCVGKEDGLNPFTTKGGSSWYVDCYKERTLNETQCPSSEDNVLQVFKSDARTCMRYDYAMKEICKAGGSIMAHPTECHMYFDCSAHHMTERSFLKEYLMECPYPDLFDRITDSCKPFDQVDCENRHEPKSPCDYRHYLCTEPNCIPCQEFYPSCEGLPNGYNVFRGRKGSPYYVTCYRERVIGRDTCPIDDGGLYKIFSPITKKCVSIVTGI